MMLGLVNRSIECFLRDTYGDAVWIEISGVADLGVVSFEAMLSYEDEQARRMIATASRHLAKPVEDLLEDVGIYLVANGRYERLRRLLRFAGETFEEFLHSVDELPDRARLALPDLELPPISISPGGLNTYEIHCRPGLEGFPFVLAGIIRAMADDYGALVTLGNRHDQRRGAVLLDVTIHEARHSTGRSFVLVAPPG
jgi:hypothetical protein